MVRSFSNLDSLTHWWNLTSSSSTLLLFPRPVDSNNTWRKKEKYFLVGTLLYFPSYFVIEPQSQLWHAGEVNSHLDVPPDLRPEDIALGSGQ